MHVSVSSYHASRGIATYQDNKLNTTSRCKPMREEVRGQTTLLIPTSKSGVGSVDPLTPCFSCLWPLLSIKAQLTTSVMEDRWSIDIVCFKCLKVLAFSLRKTTISALSAFVKENQLQVSARKSGVKTIA